MAMYIYKWIEGYDNLQEFCLKRFKQRPRFVETIGKVDEATVYLMYKQKPSGEFVEMYLLWMPHPSGTVYHIDNIYKMSYEDIRLDRNSILR